MDAIIPVGDTWNFNETDFVEKPDSDEYITPTFEIINKDNITKSPYLVIAAPGAVGKSAFAHHLARTKNAMIWNLANLRLGSNTFSGSILKAVGLSELPAFFASIKDGQTTLVFDAIDEAEVHSGWPGVQQFINDVIQHTTDAKPASVIFMTRRDTAGMIELALEEKLPENHLFTRVNIGFFSQTAAVKFILSEIKKIKGPEFSESRKSIIEEKAKAAFTITVDQPNSCSDQKKGDWQSTEQERFFGYAPVLQTISRMLAEADNLHTLDFDATRAGYPKIISDIMERILNREKLKMQGALTQRFQSGQATNIVDFYSHSEQLSRILALLNNDADTAFSAPQNATANISNEISEMVRTLLPQHPFLDGRKFAGPAFRDYVLARGLTNSSLRFDCEFWLDANQPLLTPILASLYHFAAAGEANPADIEMLYESANSGGVSGQSNLLLYISDEDPNKLIIEIASDDNDPLGQNLTFSADKPEEISFLRRLNNANIGYSGGIVLGRRDHPFEIVDSEVVAEEIRILASTLRVRTLTSGSTYLESRMTAKAGASLKVDAQPPEVLRVTWPESNKFPWHDYSVERQEDDQTFESKSILHAVSRILGWFRKDRRDEYGRYRDLIVNIVVGKSSKARYALGYLHHISALYQRGNLFFIDTKILDTHGVSWQKIRAGDISPRAITSMEEYLRNTPKPPEF